MEAREAPGRDSDAATQRAATQGAATQGAAPGAEPGAEPGAAPGAEPGAAPGAEPGARLTPRRAAVLVAIVALLVFARTIRFDFLIWDDDQHVAANARLDPPTLESLSKFWSAPFLGLYVPLSYTLFWIESWIAKGPDPRVFHAVSVLLHALNAALVVSLLSRLGARTWGAALGGLVFALHPLQVESVAWISEQRGLLAAAFGLAALCVYASPSVGLRRGPRADVLSAILLACALLSKPVAVVVPALALVLELVVLRRGARFAVPRLACAFLAAGVVLAATKSLQPDSVTGDVVATLQRPLVALDAIEFYVRKLFVPIGLAPDHGRRPALVLEHGVDASLVAVLLAIVLALAIPRVRRNALAPLALFLVGLAPVLGLVPFGHQAISTVADRYAYLALLGPALLVARAWPARPTATLAIVAFVGVSASAALSFAQSAHWRSTEAIFARTLVVNPRSWIAHTNRGLVRQNSGDLVAARFEYEAALGVKPDHARALNNLGILVAGEGHAAEGEALVRRAAEADPTYARPHMNLAAILGNQGRFDEAEISALHAVDLAPEDPAMHTTLGNVHLRQGRVRKALADFEAARALAANDVEAWLGIGMCQKALGDPVAARASLVQALELARARSPGRVRFVEMELERLRAP